MRNLIASWRSVFVKTSPDKAKRLVRRSLGEGGSNPASHTAREYKLWIAASLALLAMTGSTAHAQSTLPTAAPASAQGYFPPLPPSRPCEQQDVISLWKLQQVYQNPVGTALGEFNAQPNQYMFLKSDSTYKESKSAYADPIGTDIRAKLDQQAGTTLLQFVVGERGYTYFYRQGVIADTQVCFMVVNSKDPYLAGQLLLMPPVEQASSRLVKIYNKIAEVAPVQINPAQIPAVNSSVPIHSEPFFQQRAVAPMGTFPLSTPLLPETAKMPNGR